MQMTRGTQGTPFFKKANRQNISKLAIANNSALSTGSLTKLKRLALRRKVWYKCLNRLERGIIDLTMQCVDSIKSGKLATVVTAIINKLDSALEGMVERLVRSIGYPQAAKISTIANKLGNITAKEWATDRLFARYLAVMSLNN